MPEGFTEITVTGLFWRNQVIPATGYVYKGCRFEGCTFDGKVTLIECVIAPAPQETPRDWTEAQHWKGMDGATAALLIERHADGWGDTRAMMEAWLKANGGTLDP